MGKRVLVTGLGTFWGGRVAQALERNNDVRTAQARLQEYRSRVQVARSAQEPSLSVGFSPGRARVIGPFGTPIDSTTLQGSFQAKIFQDARH